MRRTIDSLPQHLKKYVVEQNYGRYTSEDQAVWRYIMKQLIQYLKTHAHEAYLEGLGKTGITLESIPSIEDVDRKLKEFGWSAVPISGFIPPAAFMEFQSLGILPIASDIRTIDHIHYTPAPDIVHESAGHAPILIDPEFSKYLRSYASVAKKSIFSREDLLLYEAIRELSDIKENPKSTKQEIQKCEQNLEKVKGSIRYISEASLLARMNWWTAEYGLIGSLENPKIFGAGLLSSVGESRSCLEPLVKKIPLTVDCVNYSYDITERQPQLFVAERFQNLTGVLEDLSDKMAYKTGGTVGLEKALESQTVNTVQLNTGIQISGQLEHFIANNGNVEFIKFSGPCQLSYESEEILNHGTQYHSAGYSTPLGSIVGLNKNPGDITEEDLKQSGHIKGQPSRLVFGSGFTVEGTFDDFLLRNDKVLLMSFSNCTVMREGEVFFQPEWGTFDLALGREIPSVFGGPADRLAYGDTVDFVAKVIPARDLTVEEKNLHQFYRDIRSLRENLPPEDSLKNQLIPFIEDYRKHFHKHWLIGIELLEISKQFHSLESESHDILKILTDAKNEIPEHGVLIDDGINLA